MCGRRPFREIRGRVFLDKNYDGIIRDSGQMLKGVGILLYGAVSEETRGEKGSGITIKREKLCSSAKTDEAGNFRFLVRDGIYSVCLDAGTLPPGRGAPEAERSCDSRRTEYINFAVREIDSLELPGGPVRMNIGESLPVGPAARDREGNILAANIGCRPEDERISFRSDICTALPGSLRSADSGFIIESGDKSLRVPVRITMPGVCSADRVRLARRLGMIDEHTGVGYLLQALYDKSRLPAEYRSRIPIKSGTGFVEEIRRYMEKEDADPEVVKAARQALASSVPRLDKVYGSPGGYFKIHYTLSGDNAVEARSRDPLAVPPYIEQVGRAFDNVKAATCSVRGFREPATEAGKNSYDVYVFNQKGKYGVTYSSAVQGKSGPRARAASSYICIDNSYSKEKGFDKSREDCMKVTAAHEFFHAVQSAYNVDADSWWKEASATWNEDEVYNGINDYLRYIPGYLSAPFKSLDESSYSGVIFAKFLSENYGGSNMIKKIWEVQAAGVGNSINAIDRAIRESYDGRDIGTAFDRFSACNINPAQYYKEGELWKTSAAIQDTYSSYPVALNYRRLDHLSSNYQLFKPDGPAAGRSLRITVGGAKGERWGFKLQNKKRKDKQYSMTEIVSGSSFDRAVVTLEKFGEIYDSICLIPSNLEKDRDGLRYSYTVDVIQGK